LKLPYQDNIAALLHEPSFRRAAGEAVFAKAKYINSLRNRAVHEERTIKPGDATGAVKELFHVCFWLARTYARKGKPADGLVFDASQLSRRDEALKKAFAYVKAQQAELDAKDGELTKLLADKQNLDDELKSCVPKSLPPGRLPKPSLTGTITTRPKPATATSTCCCARPDGRSTSPKTLSSASRGCRTTRASALSITCCGAPTASRWVWWKPSAPARMRAWDSSRQSFMPTGSKPATASGP
jgi:hypothetical protein